MRRNKAKPGDEQLIHDERVDSVERSSALSRLAADGRMDLEPVARQWLTSDDHHLAGEALNMLLTYWCDSPRVREYIDTAVEWLRNSDSPELRTQTVICLGAFLSLRQQCLDMILHALLKTLEQDDDSIVQETCYEELLSHVAPEEAEALRIPHGRPFNRSTDVRWELLEPLRRRFAQ